jgi:hypothetical protein
MKFPTTAEAQLEVALCEENPFHNKKMRLIFCLFVLATQIRSNSIARVGVGQVNFLELLTTGKVKHPLERSIRIAPI